MANVIIKNDERREVQAEVVRSYGIQPGNKEAMEAAEIIAARSIEAMNMAKKGGK